MIRVTAPGRVNLIGEYTDVIDGRVLPMAIDLAVTIEGERGGDVVELHSADETKPAVVALDVVDPAAASPSWARYVAGVVAELRPRVGFTGTVRTTLPIGAGLSSSAALEVAVALALGFEGSSADLAALCRRAEQRASGVPCGIMDQLASAAGRAGHALLIDCHTLEVTPMPVPEGIEVRVVHSGQPRSLADSAYAERAAALAAAAEVLGPLRLLDGADHQALATALDRIDDDTVRARARHVVTENARVPALAAALGTGDLTTVGDLMAASHRSMRDDFEISTPVIDALVDRLAATPGVHGVRLTGAGFGGCVVALTEPGVLDEGWAVRPSAGASVTET